MGEEEPPSKKQRLTQSSVNHSIDSLVLSQVVSQQSLQNSPFNPLGSLRSDQIIVIKKNDNIKKRINQVLKLLHTSSDEFMLCSQSSSIQKLLTVLEIVKQKIKGQQEIILGEEEIKLKYDKYVQYNRLDSVKSKQNPNYKPPMLPKKTDLQPLQDDEGFSEDHLKELGVLEEKVYKVPILYVYVKVCQNITKELALVGNGWSFQCSV